MMSSGGRGCKLKGAQAVEPIDERLNCAERKESAGSQAAAVTWQGELIE